MPQVGERPRDGVGYSRIQYLRITTVGSATAGACSNCRSPPDNEFATHRPGPEIDLTRAVWNPKRERPAERGVLETLA